MATDVRKTDKDLYKRDEIAINPPVDIYETDDEYVLKTDIPGVTRESLAIMLKDNELEISGSVDENLRGHENRTYAEYTLHDYLRRFTVGDGVDGAGITAKLENGVLTLVLPKSDRVKPRKIEIKVEA